MHRHQQNLAKHFNHSTCRSLRRSLGRPPGLLVSSALSRMIRAWPIAAVLVFSGCLSLNIGAAKPSKSENVKFVAPPAPFRDFKSANADHAWVNKKNGNSISYLSVCHDSADPSLEMATQDLFADLTEMQTLNTDHSTFNGREALKTEVKGEIDGVPTQITALVFKKNDCIYTLNYLGVAKTYGEDRSRFEAFLSGFEAP